MRKLIFILLLLPVIGYSQLELPYAIKVNNAIPLDYKYGPWASEAAAKAGIPQAIRYDGLTVMITGVGEYWWTTDLTDDGLIYKAPQFSSSTVKDGYAEIFTGGVVFSDMSTFIIGNSDGSTYTFSSSDGIDFSTGTYSLLTTNTAASTLSIGTNTYDATTNVFNFNNAVFNGKTSFGIGATSLTGSVNNYLLPSDNVRQRINANGDYNITGIQTTETTDWICIENVDDTNTITLVNESASSLAQNRFYLNGSDLVLQPKQMVNLMREYSGNGWIPFVPIGSGNEQIQDGVADAFVSDLIHDDASNTIEIAAFTGDVIKAEGGTITTISAGAVDEAMTSISGTASAGNILGGDWDWKTPDEFDLPTYADLRTFRTVTSLDATVQTDQFHTVVFNSGTPFNFTIDALLIGTQIYVVNRGSATVTFVNGSGVTYTGQTTILSGEKGIIFYFTSTEPEISTTP